MVFKTNRSGKAATLSNKQLEQLFDYLPEKYSLLSQVMLWGCGRVKECSSIRVRNINFQDGTIVLEKSTTKTALRFSNLMQNRFTNNQENWE